MSEKSDPQTPEVVDGGVALAALARQTHQYNNNSLTT